MQDANQPEVEEELGFSAVKPVRTVHAKLEQCGALDLLQDEQISVAVQVITNTPDKSKSRHELQREIRQKEAAVNYLARRRPNAPSHLRLEPLPHAPGCSLCHV